MTDAIERLLAEAGIRRTIAAYCHTCDDGRFDEFASYFAADAVVRLLGAEVHGRAAIKTWIERGQPPEKRGKHVTVNSVIDVTGDRGSAETDFLFLAATGDGPVITTAGRYLDTFVREGERWLFQTREIHFLRSHAPPEGRA